MLGKSSLTVARVSTQEERHAATAKSTAYAIHSLQERVAATEILHDKLEARLEAAEGLLASHDTTVTKLVHSTTALGTCGEPVLSPHQPPGVSMPPPFIPSPSPWLWFL